MRVFVGTMEHGEADFSQCVAAINGQVGVSITHFVVSNKPEKEAHELLFTRWNQVKDAHDLFLKVDADTVLRSPQVIEAYVGMFASNPRLTGVQAWLHDYMTDSLIFGLTCVRNTVNVATQVDPLYCDKADTGHDIVMRGDQLPVELRPAGMHCHSASELQAFHFGYHRGKKRQLDICERVFRAWEQNGRDRVRGMALLGFQASGSSTALNYGDEGFQELYNRAQREYHVLVGQ